MPCNELLARSKFLLTAGMSLTGFSVSSKGDPSSVSAMGICGNGF